MTSFSAPLVFSSGYLPVCLVFFCPFHRLFRDVSVFRSPSFILFCAWNSPHHSHIASCLLRCPQMSLPSIRCYCMWCALRGLYTLFLGLLWSSPFIHNLWLRPLPVHYPGHSCSFCAILKLAQRGRGFISTYWRNSDHSCDAILIPKRRDCTFLSHSCTVFRASQFSTVFMYDRRTYLFFSSSAPLLCSA